MSSGFSKEIKYSSHGRRIKPSQKIKDLLADSMLGAFDDILAQCVTAERDVQTRLDERDAGLNVRRAFNACEELFKQQLELDEQMIPYLDDEGVRFHTQRLQHMNTWHSRLGPRVTNSLEI